MALSERQEDLLSVVSVVANDPEAWREPVTEREEFLRDRLAWLVDVVEDAFPAEMGSIEES